MAITPLFGAGDCTTSTSANNTTRTVTKPANVANGDLLVAYVYSQFNAGTVTAVPSGWTLAKGLATRTGGLYYKSIPSAAAETATDYTWTVSNSGRMVITLFRVTGVDHSRPFDSSGSESSQSATSPFLLGAASSAQGHLLMSFAYWNNSSATVSTMAPDAAMTDGINVSTPTTGNTSGTHIGWQLLTSAGSTGTRSLTVSPVDASHGGFLAVFHEAGNAQLAGSGALTAIGVPGDSALATMTGSGTLTAAGTPKPAASVALSGGSLLRAHKSGVMDTWLTASPKYVAHRGGSVSWPYEETLQAYTYADAWAGPSNLAFEVSVFQTSDGVYVASHDQTTGRVFTGTSLNIPTTTWATLSSKTTIIGGYPIARLDDLLDAFPNRAWFVDNKGAQNMAAFIAILDARGGPGRFVVKSYCGSTALAATAKAAGYTTWGYYYEADTSLIASTQASWDLLGEDYNATSGTWTQIKSYGRPVLAHILPDAASKTLADTYSPDGYMVSGVENIVPQTPQPAGFSGSGTLTATGTVVTSYNLYPGTPSANTFDLGQSVYTGTTFKVTAAGWVTQIRYLNGHGADVDYSARSGSIWKIDNTTGNSLGRVVGDYTLPAPTAEDQWVTFDLPTPYELEIGQLYRVGVLHPNGGYPATAHYFDGTTDFVYGPVTVPAAGNVPANQQGTYKYTVNDEDLPDSSFNNTSYYTDVTIITAAPGTVTGTAAFTGSGTLAAAGTSAMIAAPSGIPSAEAVGTPAVTASLTVSPAGIASGLQFGTVTVMVPNGIIAGPVGIPSAEAFGHATLGGALQGHLVAAGSLADRRYHAFITNKRWEGSNG